MFERSKKKMIRIYSIYNYFQNCVVIISIASMNQTGIEQIMNLLSNDVIRFDQLLMYLNYIWMPDNPLSRESIHVHSEIIKQHLDYTLKKIT